MGAGFLVGWGLIVSSEIPLIPPEDGPKEGECRRKTEYNELL